MKWVIALFTMVFLYCLSAFAVDMPPQYENATTMELINQFTYIVTNFKVAGTLGGISMIVIFAINLTKSSVMDFAFEKLGSIGRRAIVTILGVALSVLLLKLGGASWLTAAIAGLFTTGGAVAIYEAVKPFWKK